MIRDKMASHFKDPVRPDLLNPNIEGDLHKDYELAKKIKNDNLNAIDDCPILVFPKNTTDLGTLFEVGYALRKNKIVIRYDYSEDRFEVLINHKVPKIIDFGENNQAAIDLNRLGSGVMLGYHYDQLIPCYLGSSTDNIMLMDNPHIEAPERLYPCYLENVLTESTYHLNTITSGS
jgi:hypothetical protein